MSLLLVVLSLGEVGLRDNRSSRSRCSYEEDRERAEESCRGTGEDPEEDDIKWTTVGRLVAYPCSVSINIRLSI